MSVLSFNKLYRKTVSSVTKKQKSVLFELYNNIMIIRDAGESFDILLNNEQVEMQMSAVDA